eukprot:Em0009g1075a
MSETATSILSPSYPTEDTYQRVPGSPISPSYARPSSRNQNYNVSPVPEAFSGSPLLRQILRGGLLVRGKRACTTDCSPNVAKKRRACLSPLVPNSITHSHHAQEQVVPALSPQELASVSKFEEYRRKLPEEKQSVKPLDLFNGDDIFAPSHEE